MRLWIMRHAEPLDPSRWREGDRSRPLTTAGLRHATAMGRRLTMDGGGRPEAIWHSPFRRARQTAEAVSTALGGVEMKSLEELVPGGNPFRLTDLHLEELSPERLLLVSHEPYCGLLLSVLTPLEGPHPFLVGEMACLDGSLAPGRMTLLWMRTD